MFLNFTIIGPLKTFYGDSHWYKSNDTVLSLQEKTRNKKWWDSHFIAKKTCGFFTWSRIIIMWYIHAYYIGTYNDRAQKSYIYKHIISFCFLYFRNFHALRLFSMKKGYEKMFAQTLKPLIFHTYLK